MSYRDFVALWEEAFREVGLPLGWVRPVEQLDLHTTDRRYSVRLGLTVPQPAEPFVASAELSWVWRAVHAARFATTEEDLLVALLGTRGIHQVRTERPWLRVDITLRGALPSDHPVFFPSVPAWQAWAVKVGAVAESVLPATSRQLADDREAPLGWCGQPEARSFCGPDGVLWLQGVQLAAWRALLLPRQWDDPKRPPDEPVDEALLDLARTVSAAHGLWADALRELLPDVAKRNPAPRLSVVRGPSSSPATERGRDPMAPRAAVASLRGRGQPAEGELGALAPRAATGDDVVSPRGRGEPREGEAGNGGPAGNGGQAGNRGQAGRGRRARRRATTTSQRHQVTPTYQLKVTLLDVRPVIWRRLLVLGTTRLSSLHDVLQTVMGWEDYHLHQFEVGGVCYAPRDDDNLLDPPPQDETKVTLQQVAEQDTRLLYIYDFGDSWEHLIEVEKVSSRRAQADLPVCVAGRRACPPEDCGGSPGFERLLRILKSPKHGEHQDLLTWLGGHYDPTAFDRDAVNEALRGTG